MQGEFEIYFMNKRIKSLNQKWKEAVQAAEEAAKNATSAAEELKKAIEAEMEELNKLYPSNVPAAEEKMETVEAPSDAPSSKLWPIWEIQSLLGFNYETVAQYWPTDLTQEATTEQINAVLTRLGRRPLEDYL